VQNLKTQYHLMCDLTTLPACFVVLRMTRLIRLVLSPFPDVFDKRRGLIKAMTLILWAVYYA